MAFLRLMTHPTLSENPMAVAQAKQLVEEWLEQPNCRVLPVGDRTVALFLQLISELGQGGNFCTDAMIAASLPRRLRSVVALRSRQEAYRQMAQADAVWSDWEAAPEGLSEMSDKVAQ